jgi:hypothetical protein
MHDRLQEGAVLQPVVDENLPLLLRFQRIGEVGPAGGAATKSREPEEPSEAVKFEVVIFCGHRSVLPCSMMLPGRVGVGNIRLLLFAGVSDCPLYQKLAGDVAGVARVELLHGYSIP